MVYITLIRIKSKEFNAMSESDVRRGRSVFYQNTVHLVFVTKRRRGALGDRLLGVIKTAIGETCEQMRCELIQFNGEASHVHMVVSVHPRLAVANLVGKLKGKSSYLLRRDHSEEIGSWLLGEHFWSPNYCVVSTGGDSVGVVEEYIRSQY